MNKQPFFSIVVPCYNSSPYIKELLTSIVIQNMSDEIEVILADDCSTEPYDDIVKEFESILNIKKVKTDYNFAPGNTRQKGVEAVTGQWITFIDHDDIFLENIFQNVKKKIIESGEQYYVIGRFIEADPKTNKVINVFENPVGWTHGKFFNKKNLWDAFNLKYKKDMYSHEDIYICTTVECIMENIKHIPLKIDDIILVWRAWKQSISRNKYIHLQEDHSYLEVLLDDFKDSTATVYYDNYKNGIVSKYFAQESIIQILGYLYFYMMWFIFYKPKTYIKSNWIVCSQTKEMLDELDITNNNIYDYLAANNTYIFQGLFESAMSSCGTFYIPCMSFMQFLEYLDNKQFDLE